MKVEIDPNSGFCGGVIRAIKTAEEYLAANGGRMFSLGAVVHNEEELARLESKGLTALDKDDLFQMESAQGETLMIRAHGEPPMVYEIARSKGFRIIDCTCPVVLKLQKDILAAHSRLKEENSGGKIVIFGKVGHPEVLGLVGQVDGDALVVENMDQLRERIAKGDLRLSCPIELFSQTTMSPAAFSEMKEFLSGGMEGGAQFNAHDTICLQVSHRHDQLAEFAMAHNVVVFVSGRHSSNGKVLSDLCRSCNFRTFHISSEQELSGEWFRPDDSVGVSGATSTPLWLLERVARTIENLQ